VKQALQGKVAIVTGGAKGQGRAASLLFAEEGAKVVVADWDLENAESAVAEIKAAGGQAVAVKTDVSKEEDINEMVKTAIDSFGRVDILFNNAGIGFSERGRFTMDTVVNTPVEDWDAILGINLRSVAMGCKAVIPLMIEQGGGVILNNSSINGIISMPGADAYTAAKGGVVALTRVLADVYGPSGIRVNCMCPGAVLTPMIAEISGDPNGPLKAWNDVTPLRRAGKAEELASAALFLVSDASSFVTGVILPVDGGYTCR